MVIIANRIAAAALSRFIALFVGAASYFTFSSAFALSVTLAWNPSPDPTVAGYTIFYGNYNGIYSQSLNAGRATLATVPNIVPNETFYFIVTANTGAGAQSAPSNQVVYRAGGGTPGSGN